MQDYYADEVGVLSPNQLQVDQLYAGEVENYLTWPCAKQIFSF